MLVGAEPVHCFTQTVVPEAVHYILFPPKWHSFIKLLPFSLNVCFVWLYDTSTVHVQSTLDISNSNTSNSAKLEASIWFKNTSLSLSATITWRLRRFYKSKLPEVQINLHFGQFELAKNSPINFEISRFDCTCNSVVARYDIWHYNRVTWMLCLSKLFRNCINLVFPIPLDNFHVQYI